MKTLGTCDKDAEKDKKEEDAKKAGDKKDSSSDAVALGADASL